MLMASHWIFFSPRWLSINVTGTSCCTSSASILFPSAYGEALRCSLRCVHLHVCDITEKNTCCESEPKDTNLTMSPLSSSWSTSTVRSVSCFFSCQLTSHISGGGVSVFTSCRGRGVEGIATCRLQLDLLAPFIRWCSQKVNCVSLNASCWFINYFIIY